MPQTEQIPQQPMQQPAPEMQPQYAPQPEQMPQQPAPVEVAQPHTEQVPQYGEQEAQQMGEVPQGGRAQQQQQAQQPPQPQPVVGKTKERKQIEETLSDGLTELYQSMTPEQQQVFRAKGEETASAIEEMMKNFKARAGKVVGLIREWLQTIPGVNKYFLEQESKLKADDIMKLQRKLKKESKSRMTLQR